MRGEEESCFVVCYRSYFCSRFQNISNIYGHCFLPFVLTTERMSENVNKLQTGAESFENMARNLNQSMDKKKIHVKYRKL